MFILNSFFYFLFKWQRTVDQALRTDDSRAFGAVTAISLFQCINLFSFVPIDSELAVNLVPLSVFFGINFFMFYFNDRYIKIVHHYDSIDTVLHDILSVLYVAGTILLFFSA